MDYTKLKVGDKVKLTGKDWKHWESRGLNVDDVLTIREVTPVPEMGDGWAEVRFEEFQRQGDVSFVLWDSGKPELPDTWAVEVQ